MFYRLYALNQVPVTKVEECAVPEQHGHVYLVGLYVKLVVSLFKTSGVNLDYRTLKMFYRLYAINQVPCDEG